MTIRILSNLDWIHGNEREDRKSTRLNSSHVSISYAVFCLKKKNSTVKTPLAHMTPPTAPASILDVHFLPRAAAIHPPFTLFSRPTKPEKPPDNSSVTDVRR